MKNSPICLITGLGEGTGGHTAKKFAAAGYRVAMLARTEERLRKFENDILSRPIGLRYKMTFW